LSSTQRNSARAKQSAAVAKVIRSRVRAYKVTLAACQGRFFPAAWGAGAAPLERRGRIPRTCSRIKGNFRLRPGPDRWGESSRPPEGTRMVLGDEFFAEGMDTQARKCTFGGGSR